MMRRLVFWIRQKLFHALIKSEGSTTRAGESSSKTSEGNKYSQVFFKHRSNNIGRHKLSCYKYELNEWKLTTLVKKIISFASRPLSQKLVKMEKIDEVSIGPMPSSQFVRPFRAKFKQNGKQRFWDFVKLHESVSVILFNTSRKVLVLVKQFRPAVYFAEIPELVSNLKSIGGDPQTNPSSFNVDCSKHPFSNGITLELCAGIVDNPNLSVAEIAKQEVFEECGYDVPLANFQFITSFRSGVGVSGETQSVFYAEITDAMKLGKGGGNEEEGELIDVVELSIPEMKKYISQKSVTSPSGFLFGMTWFLLNKSESTS